MRELENRIRRAIIMAEGHQLTAEDLELSGAASSLGLKTLKDAREAAEREIIVATLKRHKGKIAPSAAELEISRPTLYELMEKLAVPRSHSTAESTVPIP